MPITAQDLENAKVDAETLGDFANGSGEVTPREGAPYPSVRQFLADNQSTIDDAFAAAEAQVQYIGRVAMVYRTGAATADALVTVTPGGAATEYKNSDLYVCPMIEGNTIAGVTLKIDGLGAKPVKTSTGDPLPVPAWSVGSHVAFRYVPDSDFFVMAFNNWTRPGDWIPTSPVPSYLVSVDAVTDGGDNKLLLTSRSPLVNNTGFDQLFFIKFPADRPPESGMQINLTGVSGEYVGLYAGDRVSQVPNGAWKAGDVGIIARDSNSPFRMYVVAVFPLVEPESESETATAYDKRQDFYAMRNNQIAAARGAL